MAIGDLFFLEGGDRPVEIRFPAWTTNKNDNREYELTYDPTQWLPGTLEWDIGARQSFASFAPFGFSRLDVGINIKMYSPDGNIELRTGTLQWDAVTANDTQHLTGLAGIYLPSPRPVKISVKINHFYSVPYPPITEQFCIINDGMRMTFTALVNNPTSFPAWGSVTSTNTNPADTGYLIALAVFAVLGIAGLTALGYAADKTGLNVGSVSNIYRGASDVYSGASSRVRSAASRIREKAVVPW